MKLGCDVHARDEMCCRIPAWQDGDRSLISSITGLPYWDDEVTTYAALPDSEGASAQSSLHDHKESDDCVDKYEALELSFIQYCFLMSSRHPLQRSASTKPILADCLPAHPSSVKSLLQSTHDLFK